MAGLTLASEGSCSLVKQQLLHKLLHLRSGWTQGCRMSENKQGANYKYTSCVTNQIVPTHHSRKRKPGDENLVYYYTWPNVYKYQTNMLSPYFLH